MNIEDVYRSGDSHVLGLSAVYAAGYAQGIASTLVPVVIPDDVQIETPAE